METTTQAPVAPTTGAETTTTPTVTPSAIERVEYKKGDKVFPIDLTRHETTAKGDKSSIAYWGINREQWSGGKETPEDKAKSQVEALAAIVSWDMVADMAVSKININLKASQLEQGKDKYTMVQKAGYARDYIMADFGINSKGGGAAIKVLKETNTKQSAIIMKLVQLHGAFAKAATPDDAARILADIQKLTAEAATLVALQPALPSNNALA